MTRPTNEEIREAIENYDKARKEYFSIEASGDEAKREAFRTASRNLEDLKERNGGPLYSYYSE